MSEDRPTISILLLCWNHAAFLDQCIGSLAAQTDRSFEICFLDNGSSDGSLEQAVELFERHALPARIVDSPHGASIPVNLNRLLATSSGEIVAPLSTDDWYDPAYVARLRLAALEDTDAGWFSCSGWLYFDSEQRSEPVDDTQFITDKPVENVILEGGNPHFFVGCAYRRTALDTVDGWDEDQLIEDRDLFLRLAAAHRHHRIDARLVHYRRSGQNVSANPQFMVAGWEKFWRKHGERMPLRGRPYLGWVYRSGAATAVDRADYRLAASLLWRSMKIDPLAPRQYRTLMYLLRSAAWRRRAKVG